MNQSVSEPIIPLNETQRLHALKRYDILDTPPDGSFDRITAIASEIFQVPIAIVSLVDQDRIWFKSHHGLSVEQIDRAPGLCASAILQNDVYAITNAIEDPRTLANPLVAGEFGLRFYAAAPLRTHDGFNLGTFCVIDCKPRPFAEKEQRVLKHLAGVVMDEMELRLSARTALRIQKELVNIATHDLKNPLSVILQASDEEELVSQSLDEYKESLTMIKRSAQRMHRIVDALLETALLESREIQLNLQPVELSAIARSVIEEYKQLAKSKEQTLSLESKGPVNTLGDPLRLREIFDNLISNAIKYSPIGKNVIVHVRAQNDKAVLEVQDQGLGLTEEDQERLFNKFARLSALPTGGESATGLGLSITKKLVELHKGEIFAVSAGKNLGSRFVVELKSFQ